MYIRSMLSGPLAHSKSVYINLCVIILSTVEVLRNGKRWPRINLKVVKFFLEKVYI